MRDCLQVPPMIVECNVDNTDRADVEVYAAAKYSEFTLGRINKNYQLTRRRPKSVWSVASIVRCSCPFYASTSGAIWTGHIQLTWVDVLIDEVYWYVREKD